MSHGPSMSVYGITKKRLKEKRHELVELMKLVGYGDKEEREYVANYINKQLLKKSHTNKKGYFFTFWNHKEGQEVEDYDNLIKYWFIYSKILASKTSATVVSTADFYDYHLFCSEDQVWKLDGEDMIDSNELVNKLELKKKVKEGKEAEEKLEEVED